MDLAEHSSDDQILQSQCVAHVAIEAVTPKMAVFLRVDQPHDHAHAANGADYSAHQAVARPKPGYRRSGSGWCQPDA